MDFEHVQRMNSLGLLSP